MSGKFPFGVYDSEAMYILLLAADRDPDIAGFVYPEDTTRHRLPIFDSGKLVGFATPRQDTDEIWRMGAIYVVPEYRARGLARREISEFMRDKRGRAFIEDGNQRSQGAYAAAGFKKVLRDAAAGGCWWENF